MEAKLHGLDVCSEYGGVALALSPWVRPLVYVEDDARSVAVLSSRMATRDLPMSPIWSGGRFDGTWLERQIDIVTVTLAACGTVSRQGLARECRGVLENALRLFNETAAPFIFVAATSRAGTRAPRDLARRLANSGVDARWLAVSSRAGGHWFLLGHRPHQGSEWYAAAPVAVDRLPEVVAGSRTIRGQVAPQLVRAAFKSLLGIQNTRHVEEASEPIDQARELKPQDAWEGDSTVY